MGVGQQFTDMCIFYCIPILKNKMFMERHLYFSRHLIVNTNIKSYGMMLPIGQKVKMKSMMMSLMRDAEISQNYMRIQKYFYKFEKLF